MFIFKEIRYCIWHTISPKCTSKMIEFQKFALSKKCKSVLVGE
jgi:hypothetical protein